MGNTNSGRVRGVWSRYTPASSPFAKTYNEKIYKFPSLQQLIKFDEEVEQLRNCYGAGIDLVNEEGKKMDFKEAIEYIYNRKFDKWLKVEKSE